MSRIDFEHVLHTNFKEAERLSHFFLSIYILLDRAPIFSSVRGFKGNVFSKYRRSTIQFCEIGAKNKCSDIEGEEMCFGAEQNDKAQGYSGLPPDA